MASAVGPWKPPGANEVEMAAVVACTRQGLAAQTPGEQKAAVTTRAMIEDWFKVPKTAALLAKAATGKVQGILFFRVDSPAVRILYMAALEHRKGVGSELLAALKDLCSKKAMKEIRAAWSDKDARQAAFFKKHGFTGEKPGAEAGKVEATCAVAAAASA